MMDDRARVCLSATIGALVGGTLGYLYLTEGGQRLRRELEPRLDDFTDEMRRIRRTIDRAKVAASEGLESLDAMLTATGRESR